MMLDPEKHPHSPGRVVAKSEVITNPEGVGGPRGLVLVSSIKGVKKKTLLLWPEFFLPSSPPG